MRILNLNPGNDIGASGWHVEIDGHRILLDAGIHPKREGRASLPLFPLLEAAAPDAVAISHCHHDHVGALPVALRHFPKAHVLMTDLSYFLVERVLHNSVNVMTRQREELGIADYPLYTHTEVDEIAPRFQGFKYNREIEWAAFAKIRSGFPSPTLEFFDAGHTLGSAGILLRGRAETLFYTGDVCFHDQTLLRGARFDDVTADVLIMETTRGDRAIPSGFSREKEIDRLAAAIQRVLGRKGSVLIPTFALGRTQEILALLALLMRSRRLKKQPVYISGLGRVFTEIYDLEAHRAHRQHSGLKLTEALPIIVLERQQAEQMKLASGRLFVLTAGMMSENTASHDLARRLFAEPRHAIFFVGYADPDTPAGRLQAAPPGQPFLFHPGRPPVACHCEVERFDLSAHAHRDAMLEWIGEVNPRVVVLGHGNPVSIQWFATEIHRRYPHIRVTQPGPGQTVVV